MTHSAHTPVAGMTASPSSALALSADDVTVSYGGVHAVQAVSLTLRRGEILGLIGPNGAGKTTLIDVLSGFRAPTTGCVRIDDRNLTNRSVAQFVKHGVSRTFQGVRLFTSMTVEENVRVATLRACGSRRAAATTARALLETLAVADLAERSCAQLPQGDARRVSVARAMARQPVFLLLDEPAAGLNEPETAALAATIRQICADRGCGVLIVEHDMRLIMGLCDRLQVLDSGRTIAIGHPTELRHDAKVIEAYLGSQGSDAAASSGEPT